MHVAREQIDFTCRVCDEEARSDVFEAREMMYGSRERFEYVCCGACGCLQIRDVPADLGRFYPSDYYSHRPRAEPEAARGVKGLISRWVSRAHALRPAALSTVLLDRFLPMPGDFAEYGDYIREARLLSATERILDVGCGASPHRLAAIQRCGFHNVEGVDPFIAEDIVYHGVPVRKRAIADLDGTFGLVMFHHSLEHTTNPAAALLDAARLLRRGGTCLVRVPVAGTYFWRYFGTDWVELDAPRHLHIPSLEAMRRLAARTGFRVRRTVFDSEPWELRDSLRYSRDIALRDIDPLALAGEAATTQHTEQVEFVDQLNRLCIGGRACFYLEHQ